MYEVRIIRAAENDLKRISLTNTKRISKSIRSLSDNPRPKGCVKLRGADNEWRIRVGDYRVIYAIDDKAKNVTLTDIKHRRQAYT